MESKVALVTGASSGFGKLTAEHLLAAGYRVFGTSRRPRSHESIEMLQLDVQSDDSVEACVTELIARAGRIDLLVNNAGQIHASVVEETSLDVARDVFETNFWGVVRVTRAVLPSMRRQKSGHIINVGSLAGLIGVPGQGFYSASKFALEGYSETLAIELTPFGIGVSLIEPGFFRTSLHEGMSSSARRIDDYDAIRSGIEQSIARSIEGGDDPVKVAHAIVQVAKSGSARLRHRVGDDARWVPRFKSILPERFFRRAILSRFSVK